MLLCEQIGIHSQNESVFYSPTGAINRALTKLVGTQKKNLPKQNMRSKSNKLTHSVIKQTTRSFQKLL